MTLLGEWSGRGLSLFLTELSPQEEPRRAAAVSENGLAMPVDFDVIYREGYPVVFRAARLASGDTGTAEEATQEAFARALARWKRLGGEPWVVGWVMTTALNLVRRKRRPAPLPYPGETDGTNQDAAARVDLERAILDLPSRQRTAVCLYYLLDLTVKDVATVMGCRDGTVKALLSQARSRLARAIAQEDSDGE